MKSESAWEWLRGRSGLSRSVGGMEFSMIRNSRRLMVVAIRAARVLVLVATLGWVWPGGSLGAGLGAHRVDPAQVVPLDQLPAASREEVAEVIRDATFHRQSEPDTFPCDGNLYLHLVNEPLLPLNLWKDLADSPVQLRKIAPNRYQGSDGSGSTAIWEFVHRSARLHVMLAYFNFVSPRGNARVEARIVLLVHADYVRSSGGEPMVRHDVEAFVKVDSKGWKTLARTVRPVVERVLEDQVREAGYFISLMSRLVINYPNWACQVVSSRTDIDPAMRKKFRDMVERNRKPGASSGRPSVLREDTAMSERRR